MLSVGKKNKHEQDIISLHVYYLLWSILFQCVAMSPCSVHGCLLPGTARPIIGCNGSLAQEDDQTHRVKAVSGESPRGAGVCVCVWSGGGGPGDTLNSSSVLLSSETVKNWTVHVKAE